MYLMITDRCNMSCEHCCSNCTEQGSDMSLETVDAFLKLIPDEMVTIGGGEPTLHPQFFEILCRVIANSEHAFVVTNGSLTEEAIRLAKMASKCECLGCALSQDPWHDPIDWEVVETFQNLKQEIRDVSTNKDGLSPTGRALTSGLKLNPGLCVCAGFTVKPNGDIYACGCDDAPLLGNVHTTNDPYSLVPADYMIGECFKYNAKEGVYLDAA